MSVELDRQAWRRREAGGYEWEFRDQLLAFTQRWPLVLLAFLLGGLLGWVGSLLAPSQYRAEAGMYVGFNADLVLRNPDDYKNWQLAAIEELMYSKPALQETLNRLRARDPSWNDTNPVHLAAMLDLYWRNAGKWELVATDASPARAEQAARLWAQVSLEQIQATVGHAVTALALGKELDRLSQALVQGSLRAAELGAVQAALADWTAQAAALPAGDPLPAAERWRLLDSAARAAGFQPAGLALMQQAPAAEAPRAAYLPWAANALAAAEAAAAANQAQLAALGPQRETLLEQWKRESALARGMTAYLRVEPLEQPGAAIPVRTPAETALVGGGIGVALWTLIGLAWPRRAARQTHRRPA